MVYQAQEDKMALITYRAYILEGGAVYVTEDVCGWIAHNLKGHGAVMILKWRLVVIPQGQLCFGVNLITVRTVHR